MAPPLALALCMSASLFSVSLVECQLRVGTFEAHPVLASQKVLFLPGVSPEQSSGSVREEPCKLPPRPES